MQRLFVFLSIFSLSLSANASYDDILIGAATIGDLAIFDDALKAGANVNAKDRSGTSVLQIVIENMAFGSLFATPEQYSKALTTSKSGISYKSHYFLHRASTYNDMFLILIKRGANVNHKDKQGLTPLDYAGLFITSLNGYENLMYELLKNGAKPELSSNLNELIDGVKFWGKKRLAEKLRASKPLSNQR